MSETTFSNPDPTTFMGLTAVGQRIAPERVVIEHRMPVGFENPFCRSCGAHGMERGIVAKRLAHVQAEWRPTESRCWAMPGSLPEGCSTSSFRGRAWWPCPPTVRRCFWTARSSRPSLTRRRRSAGRRTCSRRSRAASRWAPSLGAAQASPSNWRSTGRASWWSSPARASRWWRRPERGR